MIPYWQKIFTRLIILKKQKRFIINLSKKGKAFNGIHQNNLQEFILQEENKDEAFKTFKKSYNNLD